MSELKELKKIVDSAIEDGVLDKAEIKKICLQGLKVVKGCFATETVAVLLGAGIAVLTALKELEVI